MIVEPDNDICACRWIRKMVTEREKDAKLSATAEDADMFDGGIRRENSAGVAQCGTTIEGGT